MVWSKIKLCRMRKKEVVKMRGYLKNMRNEKNITQKQIGEKVGNV
jgi:DNA-binding XRE family transcriptional regulator